MKDLASFRGRANDIRSSIFTEILTDKVLDSYKRETKSCVQLKFSSIVTDGIACSVVLTGKDLIAGNGNVFKNFTSKTYPERYIHSLSAENVEKLKLKDKRIVAIDPNEYDLMHCVSPNPAVTITPEQISQNVFYKKDNFQKSEAKNAKVLKEERNNYKIYQSIPTLTLIARLKPKHWWNTYKYTAGERHFDRKSTKYRSTEKRKKKIGKLESTIT
ncbi:hypothetical protein P9112_004101 [Eukaryota sp. TZLM1-RC]